MAWELFKRVTRVSPRDPMVTLSKNGMINLNSAVMRNLIGDNKFAHLLFEKEKHQIGIKFLKQKDIDAYPVRATKNKGNGSIAGVAFLKTYEIFPSETRAYNATFNEAEKMLIVDISEKKGEQKVVKRTVRFPRSDT